MNFSLSTCPIVMIMEQPGHLLTNYHFNPNTQNTIIHSFNSIKARCCQTGKKPFITHKRQEFLKNFFLRSVHLPFFPSFKHLIKSTMAK